MIEKLNDSSNHPLRFVDTEAGVVIGQFYNSIDKKYHLAQYIPYCKPPTKYLCSHIGNFSSSRNEDVSRNICEECFNILRGKYDLHGK